MTACFDPPELQAAVIIVLAVDGQLSSGQRLLHRDAQKAKDSQQDSGDTFTPRRRRRGKRNQKDQEKSLEVAIRIEMTGGNICSIVHKDPKGKLEYPEVCYNMKLVFQPRSI